MTIYLKNTQDLNRESKKESCGSVGSFHSSFKSNATMYGTIAPEKRVSVMEACMLELGRGYRARAEG
ncbi:hypothetical protein MPER_12491 [Moniliophthora perniciosa FA553]|nr:hypothetical protein MPER_12491 [Moniliophthora perniciosa FA553]